MTAAIAPPYALLLDVVAPAAEPRVDPADWDRAAWTAALQAADWHRLTPALHVHLGELAVVPHAVEAVLHEAYLANAARMMFVGRMLDAALACLGEHGVPVMVLKGAALVELAYDDRALREMTDIDLLVAAHDLDRARGALGDIGYDAIPAAGHAHPGRDEHHHDEPLVESRRVAAIELHHHIATVDEGWFAIDAVWRRARPSRRMPAHLLPGAVDLLIHVCLHFTRNRIAGHGPRAATGGALAQIHDIARLVARDPVDWELFVATARAQLLETPVFLALFTARELGVEVEPTALRALRPPRFDETVGRRLLARRVLRSERHVAVESVWRLVAPPRKVLERDWAATPGSHRSLARAYLNRAATRVPAARAMVTRPWTALQDHRLDRAVEALGRAPEAGR